MNYTTEYSIYTPQLKSSTGRLVKVNPKLGNFTYHFDPLVLKQFELNAVSFCFFILWDRDGSLNGHLNPYIWLKKEISIAQDKKINLGDAKCFDKKFFEDEPLLAVKCKQRFFAHYQLNASYLVIRDLKGREPAGEEQSVAIDVAYDDAANRLKKVCISLGELQSMLIHRSNGPVHMKKKLYSYETYLEKYLSETCGETGALFPGDCDMLLFDGCSTCKYIVEFKKTTGRDQVPIKDQSFLNFLCKDRNKFTRLNILRNYFSAMEGKTIPFVTVFYPVTDENEIKIEVISPEFEVEKECLFTFGMNPASNQKMILENIIKLCG